MAERELPPPPPPPPPPPVRSHSPSSDEDSVEQVVANGRPAGTTSVSVNSNANGGSSIAAESTSSYVHLRSLLQELIDDDKDRFGGLHYTVEDLMSQIGDSARARRFEAEAKALNVEKFKLSARKQILRAEVFGFLAQVD